MLFGAKFDKHLAKESTRKGGAQSYPDVPAELEAGTPMFRQRRNIGGGSRKGQPVAAAKS